METPERRLKQRYPIERGVRYSQISNGQHLLARSGSGLTANISSCGLLFRSDEQMNVGDHVALEVDWPGVDRGGESILRISGVVSRSEPPTVAVRIGRYSFEFRKAESASEKTEDCRTELATC